MGIFKKKLQDERVVTEQNKIYREIYTLIFIICLISLGAKFYLYGVSITNVMTEWIIFLVAGVYYSIRAVQKGLFSSEVEAHDNKSKWSYQTKTIVIGIIFGMTIGIVFGANSAYSYADSTSQAVYYFFLTFLVSMMMYIPVFVVFLVVSYSIAKNRSDKVVDKQLEDEE